jgi:lysine-specific demethylase/histidyl-hydroxylase NO66
MNNKKKLVKRIKIVDPSKNVGYKKPKIQQSSNGSAVEPTRMMHTKKEHDSIEEGKEMFEWIINPMSVDDFMENYWEKKPKHIKRPNNKNYYHSLMTMQTIQNMIRENHLEYTKNVDITSYRDGTRETHNPEGKVTSSLWSFYDEGCSIRLLNPQTFVPTVFKMNAKLQEYFHCMVGTNVYLTPKDTQGFAPHYDDIEAFILQLEGQKHWRIYEPRTADEFLARDSSINFSQDEIGEPIMDIILEAGEMLYFPRGFIHQGVAIDGQHSLHITVSMYQKNSYADLLEHLVPAALKQAIESDVRFREGLPLNIHQVCGSVYSDVDSNERNEVRDHIKELFSRIFDHANIDNAVDQMSKKFQTDALPPHISKHEKQRTAFGERVEIEDGEVSLPFEITAETNIRLLKANILRLVEEEDTYRVYFHTENSKEYHEFEPTFMEIEEDDTGVIAKLVHSYPDFIAVSDLPAEDDERKIAIVSDLWEKGLLMTDVTVD